MVDVFNQGADISRQEAGVLVEAFAGRAMRNDDLDAAGTRQIILRMLRNLNASANQQAKLKEPPMHYLDAIIALVPDSPLDRLERARARMQASDVPGARDDLRWLVEHKPKGVNMDQIEVLLRSLNEE